MEVHDYANRISSVLNELGISEESVKSRGLAIYLEAESLVVAETSDNGKEHWLEPEAAEAWLKLRRAASNDGVSIYMVSAFRSVSRQTEIIRRKLSQGLSLENILAVSAAPGYSEHHTGKAIDIGTLGCTNLEEIFESTPAFSWLSQHASSFGFVLSYPRNNSSGYAYEPWHWFYQGTSSNKSMQPTPYRGG